MKNVALALATLTQLVRNGVTEFCVCAGSRNSPLLALLGAAQRVRLFSFVDERSAAFFAVGRMKLHGAPVAVVTTSGTAAAELLPAAIEAYYSRLPLVLVTADRPARFRGTGAPQCIDQDGLFGVYAATSVDSWSAHGPLHLNLEFDEPLIDAPPPAAWDTVGAAPPVPRAEIPALEDVLFDEPLIVIGGLAAPDLDRARTFARSLGRPVFAEPLSGLREDADLVSLLVSSGERALRELQFDGVIRIGEVPVFRFWRDLEERCADVPVVHFTDGFSGLTRGEQHPLRALPRAPRPRKAADEFMRVDRELAAKVATLIESEPDSEVAMLRRVSLQMPKGSRVYLGNSLPIREWDLAATRTARGLSFQANRGANGIDGQISTFFGQCDPQAHNVCIVGDLTALYDSNAGWIIRQMDPATRFTIYIVNNGGGQIFSRVSSLQAIERDVRKHIVENAHDFDFAHWAAMWRLPYGDTSSPRGVIELRPDAEATGRFWQRYDALWSERG